MAAFRQRIIDAAQAANELAPPLLRIQPEIQCVCAAQGGMESLLALYEHVGSLVTATPPLLPSAGFVIPREWTPA